MEISRPTNDSMENPSFVFDYLACTVNQKREYQSLVIADESDLCWAEIKTGNRGLSDNQVVFLASRSRVVQWLIAS